MIRNQFILNQKTHDYVSGLFSLINLIFILFSIFRSLILLLLFQKIIPLLFLTFTYMYRLLPLSATFNYLGWKPTSIVLMLISNNQFLIIWCKRTDTLFKYNIKLVPIYINSCSYYKIALPQVLKNVFKKLSSYFYLEDFKKVLIK